MNVLLFLDTVDFAGTERHVLDLALALDAAGVSVTVACPAESALARKSQRADLDILPIQAEGTLHPATVSSLTGLLRAGQAEIIHSHNGRTALASALAVRLAGRGCCVATQHFLEPNHTQQRGLKAVPGRLAHRWVNAHTHQFIAISEAVRLGMRTRREAGDDRITVVPNGLACDDRSLAPPAQVRAELSIPADAPLVVCVARLEPEKDIPLLLAAMETVRETVPTAQAVVVGDGSQRQALEAQIEERGLASSVHLAGFREDARAVIRAGDVFVLPSRAEPFGLVLLEAMALGRPVIATRAGGPCEIVADGETGRLVPPGDPDALAGALSALLTEPETRRRLGANGLRRYRERYTAERMAEDAVAVYRRALQLSQR